MAEEEECFMSKPTPEVRTETLAEIRARREKITPGKWRRCRCANEECFLIVAEDEICEAGCGPDADFIAHAPEDIDSLLAEVERLRGIEKAAKQFVSTNNNVVAIAKTYQRLLILVAQSNDAAMSAAKEG